jgi:4-cresol dehydrogenase (hydroxylating)
MSSKPLQRVLPSGFDEPTFDEALNAIAKVVGAENVSHDSLEGSLEGPQGQKRYGDVWPLGSEDAHTPGGAIRPGNVLEVQGVLRIANQYKLPLWTVSRGRNLGSVLTPSFVFATANCPFPKQSFILSYLETKLK